MHGTGSQLQALRPRNPAAQPWSPAQAAHGHAKKRMCGVPYAANKQIRRGSVALGGIGRSERSKAVTALSTAPVVNKEFVQ